jgi:hypothetical protein
LQTFTATNITIASGDISTNYCSLARFGLYSIDTNGNGTLVTSTIYDGDDEFDRTIFTNTYTVYQRNLTNSYSLITGIRYALSFKIIAINMPTIYGIDISNGFLYNQSPIIAGNIIEEDANVPQPEDLVASITSSLTVSNSVQWIKLS